MENVDVKCDKCGSMAYQVLVNTTCTRGSCSGKMRPLKADKEPVKCSVEKPCKQCVKLGAKAGVPMLGNKTASVEVIEVEDDWQLVQDHVEDEHWSEVLYALARMRDKMLKLEAYVMARKVTSA